MIGSLQASRCLLLILILFPNVFAVWYLGGHVILSDRAMECSQLGVDSVEWRTTFPSPAIIELISCSRLDIFAELGLGFPACEVFAQQYKIKRHLYRLLKLFCKLLLEEGNTWWNIGHSELVKNQKLISLFPSLLHSKYLSMGWIDESQSLWLNTII